MFSCWWLVCSLTEKICRVSVLRSSFQFARAHARHTKHAIFQTLSPLLTSVTFVPQARPVAGLQPNGKTIRKAVVFGVFLRLERWTLKTSLSFPEEQGSPHLYKLRCRYLRAGGRSAALRKTVGTGVERV